MSTQHKPIAAMEKVEGLFNAKPEFSSGVL
jgi:hypothetical protein